MGTLERPVDRGTRVGRSALIRLGSELRDARRGRGLSLAVAARGAGISTSQLGRIERGQAPRVPLITLARCAAVVGLDLSSRLFPGGHPVRDASQIAMLGVLRAELHPSLGWDTEVVLPTLGDKRAWDAVIRGPGWKLGVEAETAPRDLQATTRRVNLKLRDSGVEGAILLVRRTRRNHEILRAEEAALGEAFPVGTRQALDALHAGMAPMANALVVLAVPVDARPGSAREGAAARVAAEMRRLPPGGTERRVSSVPTAGRAGKPSSPGETR